MLYSRKCSRNTLKNLAIACWIANYFQKQILVLIQQFPCYMFIDVVIKLYIYLEGILGRSNEG